MLITSSLKLIDFSKHFVMLHMFQKFVNWIFFLFFFFLIRVMCIEILNMFQNIGSIHETHRGLSVNFNIYQIPLFLWCSYNKLRLHKFKYKEIHARHMQNLIQSSMIHMNFLIGHVLFLSYMLQIKFEL